MDIKTIKNTEIYNTFADKDFFLYRQHKVVCNVDTFYYSVFLDSACWGEDKRKNKLIDYLKHKREESFISFSPVSVFSSSLLLVSRPYSFGFYNYHFGRQDCFDFFISDYVPNADTCQVICQLRSQYLWLNGLKKCIDDSLKVLDIVLSSYDIKIKNVQENRIDIAYHTNYIQDICSYFQESDLKEMQVSNFQRWHKEGTFQSDVVECDYFTLGRRKSNNVFFRAYNKTKEVIEMQYKQFFILYWYENGLISAFDKWLLEKCIEQGSYEYKEKARCIYYLENGTNDYLKGQIQLMLDNSDKYSYSDYSSIIKGYVPDLTIITNLEFQVKRKYFYNLQMSKVTNCNTYKQNIYNFLEYLTSLQIKLTTDTLRFVKYKGQYSVLSRTERPVSDLWNRVQHSKIKYVSKTKYTLYRDYQKEISVYIQKVNAVNRIACYSAYNIDVKGNSKGNFIDDFVDFVSSLTDNDIHRYEMMKSKKYKLYKSQGFFDV